MNKMINRIGCEGKLRIDKYSLNESYLKDMTNEKKVSVR